MRFRNYAWYWVGLVASVFGFRALEFAQFWQMHELTGSPLYLGLLGLASGVPAIALNLIGGVTADRFRRRRIVITTQLGMALPVLCLGLLTTLGETTPAYVLVVAAVVSALNSFNTPARLSLYPQYVDGDAILSAVALNSAAWQTARIAAPAGAGLVIATLGTAWVYYSAGVGMLVLGVVMFFLPDVSRERIMTKALHDLLQGLRFIAHTPPFAFLITITFIASFFGFSYITLMPVFAVDVLDVGAEGQGVLLAVAGAGSLIATMLVGGNRSTEGKSWLLWSSALASGLSLITFAGSAASLRSYTVATVAIFMVGISSTVFTTCVMSTLQVLVPDALRGRVMGFWAMMWNITPLGGLLLGMMAEGFGAPVAVGIGGLVVLLTVGVPAVVRLKTA